MRFWIGKLILLTLKVGLGWEKGGWDYFPKFLLCILIGPKGKT